MQELLAPIKAFLGCETPDAWIEKASEHSMLQVILVDHCNCELKAAQTALYLLRKYAVDAGSGEALLAWARPFEEFVYHKDRDMGAFLSRIGKRNVVAPELLPNKDFGLSQEFIVKIIRLIKEEFHHFVQVLEIMASRGISYTNLSAGRYARSLMRHVRTSEPAALVDKLIVGAFIEARSCERFAKLAPLMEPKLARFYTSLLRSEARHYQDYLQLAEAITPAAQNGTSVAQRVAYFAAVEAQLVLSEDDEFRFHSGVPLN